MSFATLLCIAAVLSAAEPAGEAPDSGDRKHLSAADIYKEPNTAVGIRTLMGQLVNVEVEVTIERDVPLVHVVEPAGSEKILPISAHLISVTTLAAELKKDQRWLIKGIIVHEGYGAYVIYLHGATPAK